MSAPLNIADERREALDRSEEAIRCPRVSQELEGIPPLRLRGYVFSFSTQLIFGAGDEWVIGGQSMEHFTYFLLCARNAFSGPLAAAVDHLSVRGVERAMSPVEIKNFGRDSRGDSLGGMVIPQGAFVRIHR